MKLRIYLIILSLLGTCITAQELIYPQFPSDEIAAIHFLNQDEILLFNDGGAIYKSYDGGYTWDLKTHLKSKDVISLKFIDDDTGILILDNVLDMSAKASILTTDAGETWDIMSLDGSKITDYLPISESYGLKSNLVGEIFITENFIVNSDTVYQVPMYSVNDPNLGNLSHPSGYIKTFDEVATGSIFALGENVNAFTAGVIHDSLSFILLSENSGNSWERIWSGSDTFIEGFDFIDKENGWMYDLENIYRTKNGGESWDAVQINASTEHIRDLMAVSNEVLYATNISPNFSLLNSEDGGETWGSKDLPVSGVSQISFYDSNIGFLFGEHLIKTNDGGNSWEEIFKPIIDDVLSVKFYNTQIGIANSKQAVYKTNNGGKSWYLVKEFENNGIGNSLEKNKVNIVDNGSGWVITSNTIYKTKDYGDNWEETELPIINKQEYIFSSIEFYDNNLGVILNVAEETNVGSNKFENKYNYITVNGGESWNHFEIADEYLANTFYKVKFTDPGHLFAIGNNGFLMSRDTAKTWENIYYDDSFFGNFSFDFADSLFGVLSISYSKSFVTVDGGKNWKVFEKPIGSFPNDCAIVGVGTNNEQTVLECGKEGKIIRYTFSAGGSLINSEQITTNTSQSLNNIDVLVNEKNPHVWVAGNGFSILYEKYGKIVTDIIEETNTNPSAFSLAQNYPNPFNPTTTITYSLPNKAYVNLKIYNSLGKEVKTLVAGHQPSGTHSIKFDASQLSSGVYFYSLEASGKQFTKKMVLLK